MIDKTVLERYYQSEHLSTVEIAHKLNIKPSHVRYWLEKYGIDRRSHSHATYVKRNPSGDPFKIKKQLSIDETFLLGLGLGLYWGEGTKANLGTVRLGNSDPELIRTFLRFLTEICGVNKDKIRFGLQVFQDIDTAVALKYWQTELDFPLSHFHPKVIRSLSTHKGSYTRKLPYGVLTVYVGNKKLRNWLVSQLIKLRNKPI